MKTILRRINMVTRPSRVDAKLKLKVSDESATVSTEIAFTINNHLFSVAQVLDANIRSLPDNPTANVKRISFS